eukprot:GHRQ01029221.1.p2 GENE.GHRQ01029221.1~~GHRQ01029221.1.p2  ORF type:complete len:144 (+),score=26.10 GHRQ01029221.1:774-1205(+)
MLRTLVQQLPKLPNVLRSSAPCISQATHLVQAAFTTSSRCAHDNQLFLLLMLLSPPHLHPSVACAELFGTLQRQQAEQLEVIGCLGRRLPGICCPCSCSRAVTSCAGRCSSSRAGGHTLMLAFYFLCSEGDVLDASDLCSTWA